MILTRLSSMCDRSASLNLYFLGRLMEIHGIKFNMDWCQGASPRDALPRDYGIYWGHPQSVWRNGSILARNNSGPARPYMARLRVFRRLI